MGAGVLGRRVGVALSLVRRIRLVSVGREADDTEPQSAYLLKIEITSVPPIAVFPTVTSRNSSPASLSSLSMVEVLVVASEFGLSTAVESFVSHLLEFFLHGGGSGGRQEFVDSLSV